MKNAKIKNKKIEVEKKRMFENFEYSPALKFGLNAAIEEINNKGLGIIERDIKKKSIFFQRKARVF